ncbi:hypothetical protein [Lampropedia aestuarii]|uniref:hypothetical protein n=1 Tax=Lampropedia aestuarii TaxID=2562762 RepID=UPI002469BE49|nr:hypothetical protein [Lampropedia aestuarii]MDH5856731.1 hypothetical protein [Lampropedia aestuarii]
MRVTNLKPYFFSALILTSAATSANQHFWIEPKTNNLKDVVVVNDVGGSVDGFYSYAFGKALELHSKWNVGDFSKLYSPNPMSDYQASIDPDWYGSTSIQKIGNETTIHLSSYSLPQPSIFGYYYMG